MTLQAKLDAFKADFEAGSELLVDGGMCSG
jgi:hypothetical protein